MEDISFLLAFSAGLLSFLSPCVLPLVPAYFTYLTGTSAAEITTGRARFDTLYKAMGFVIGFSIVFIFLGASVTSLGKLLTVNKDILRKAGGIIIVILGLHMTGFFKIKLFYTEKKLFHYGESNKSISSILMGMSFAAGWTPCIGPILSSILIYAGSMETISKGIFLLISYSLGLAVPFILTALAVESFTKYFRKFSKYLPAVSIVSGLVIIVMGIMVFTNKVNLLSRYFDFFPSL